MKRLLFKSWLLVLYVECLMRFYDFKVLHVLLRKERVQSAFIGRRRSSEELCRAVDLACVFYFKPVFCLQRSAATTLLLRRHGWSAEMVIGIQVLPLRSHAWVELDGVIVNDKPYISDIYRELERC